MSSKPGRGRARGKVKAQAETPARTPEQAESVRPKTSPSPPQEASPEKPKPAPGQFKDASPEISKEIVETCKSKIAKRPGYGKNSIKNIRLYTNYFNLRLPTGVVYQYDVEIVQEKIASKTPNPVKDKKRPGPTRLPERVTKHVFNQMVKSYSAFAKHHPVYDGNKTLVTRYPLDKAIHNQDLQVSLNEDGRTCSFFVTVKPALTMYGEQGEVNLDSIQKYCAKKQEERPLDAIRIMDLIFRHGPMMNLVPVGRSFFIKPPSDEDLPPFGGGREIWFGYTQSVRPTEWGPLLNVDITATVFYKEGPFLNFAKQVLGYDLGNKRLDLPDQKKLSKEVLGLRVRTTHSKIPRKYTIAGLSNQGANQIKFKLDGASGKEVTIEQYFREQYKCTLRFPSLPCLQVQPKTKNTFIPMEVCVMLPEQHCKRRLLESQSAMMIKKTCKNPQQRFKEIRNRLEQTRTHSAPFIDYFGIELGKDLVEVNSRVLQPPVVLYAQPQTLVPREGVWNITNQKFFNAAEIKTWILINYGNCNRGELDRFSNMLQSEGNRLGMKFSGVMDIMDLRNERRLGVAEVLRRTKSNYDKLELVVLVIPGRGESRYAEIKKAGDVDLGIVTQCIKDINVSRKCNPSLLGNLCQKINAKMGGINNSVVAERPFKTPALFDEPVIVFGADVTHPSPDDHAPSVAAVVASLDRHPSRFAARVQVQKSTMGGIQSRVELILDLKTMVKELLIQFYKATKQKPQKIYFLRDGVSETQFPEILNYEVGQIRQACKALQQDYQPAVTFLCVQKRHHTRFCPKNPADGCGRPGNVPPGTTVDTGIVNPIDFDFFLCSHFGLQGTSRPTHYSVLLDENNLSADQVQALCYHLCHTYARCTRSLSIPAPVQYAHLAAFRARSHLAQVMDVSSGGSSTGSHSSGDMYSENEKLIEEAVKVISGLQNEMYFV